MNWWQELLALVVVVEFIHKVIKGFSQQQEILFEKIESLKEQFAELESRVNIIEKS